MTKTRPPFEFVGVMREEVVELQSALKRARILHSDSDIDSGGHHFEDSARTILQRRLPGRYDLGKGHVVDHGWASSTEFDVVIADVSAGSIFFTASDGTRYYPFEGVYGLGEVKSSYRHRDRQLAKLVEAVTFVKSTLRREPTPSNFATGLGAVPMLYGDWPYRNPLFTFALFAEAGDFEIEHVAEAYAGVPWKCLPNVLCFLDKGIVALCEMVRRADSDEYSVGPLVTVPEFATVDGGEQYAWVLLPMGEGAEREAGNLVTLQWAIVTHIEKTVLMPAKPEMLKAYLDNAGLTGFSEPVAVRANRPPGDRPPETLRG
jgi:hypothetical protein